MSLTAAQTLRLAFAGTETRYVARLYLTRMAIVAFGISAAVLAIDIAGNFERVMAASGRVPLPPGMARVAQYLLLRLAYNTPAVLPLACAIGIVWAEWSLTRAHERTVITNTGRAPLVSLAPALLVGLLAGALQFGALTQVRPLAVEAQGQMGFRYYGPRLSARAPETRWIPLHRAVLHTEISFAAEGALLRDVTLYELEPDNALRAITRAPLARVQGTRLTFDTPQRWSRTGDPGPDDVFIDPVWLRNLGIERRFITQADLAHLARGGPGVAEASLFRATLLDRRAAPVRLIALAVLMASLCLSILRPRRTIAPALILIGAGYGVHFLTQFLSILGDNGRLPLILSLWALPCVILAGCLWFHLSQERMVAKAMARHATGPS